MKKTIVLLCALSLSQSVFAGGMILNCRASGAINNILKISVRNSETKAGKVSAQISNEKASQTLESQGKWNDSKVLLAEGDYGRDRIYLQETAPGWDLVKYHKLVEVDRERLKCQLTDDYLY